MAHAPSAVIYLYQAAGFPPPAAVVMPTTPETTVYSTPVAVAFIYPFIGAATDPLPDAPAPGSVPFAFGYIYGDDLYVMEEGSHYGTALLLPVDQAASSSIVNPGGVVGPEATLYAVAYIPMACNGFLYVLTSSPTAAPQGFPYAAGFLYPDPADWAPPLGTIRFITVTTLAELEQQHVTADEVMITLETIGPISNLQELLWVMVEMSDANPGWTFTQRKLVSHVNRFAEALSDLCDHVIPGLSANPSSDDAQVRAMERAEHLKKMAKGLKRFGLKDVCNKIANRLHRIVQRVRGPSKKNPGNYLEQTLEEFMSTVHGALELPVQLP